MPSARGDLYSFESLTVNNFIHNQDGWFDQAGQGQAVISLDETDNGTKVVRHLPTVNFNQSAFLTRLNDESFSFLPFTGTETNAVIQFDANGEHLAMFALGVDRNGDGVLKAVDGELGPAFGVNERKFTVQEANLGTVYEDGFSEGGGDGNSGEDWYRLQLRIDFTAAEGNGIGSLYFLNLSHGDTVYRSVSGMRNLPLGLSGMHPDAGPARWNAMWLHLLTMGSRIPEADNLVPNLNTIRVTRTSLNEAGLVLDWKGGIGPYQVQSRSSLDSGTWTDFGVPTEATTVTVPITGNLGFFRVIRP